MKRTIILFLIASLSGLSLYAQSNVKLGHINVMELWSYMPGFKEADAQFEAYARQLEQQNRAMLEEYQKKIEEYTANEANMMDAIKEIKQKEIIDLEDRIQTFQETAQEKLAKKKEELYGPILEKAEKAINEVAKSNGFTYIFDTSSGSLAYFDGGVDIMPLVKKHLGIQ